jgi:hypothetical protein
LKDEQLLAAVKGKAEPQKLLSLFVEKEAEIFRAGAAQ